MKYLHETIMRQAFIAAAPAFAKAGWPLAIGRTGSKLLPGWTVDRANKRG